MPTRLVEAPVAVVRPEYEQERQHAGDDPNRREANAERRRQADGGRVGAVDAEEEREEEGGADRQQHVLAGTRAAGTTATLF